MPRMEIIQSAYHWVNDTIATSQLFYYINGSWAPYLRISKQISERNEAARAPNSYVHVWMCECDVAYNMHLLISPQQCRWYFSLFTIKLQFLALFVFTIERKMICTNRFEALKRDQGLFKSNLWAKKINELYIYSLK